MTKKRAPKTTAKAKVPVKDLPPRNSDTTKGGFSALSDAVKSIGEALQTSARKG